MAVLFKLWDSFVKEPITSGKIYSRLYVGGLTSIFSWPVD